MKALVTGGAGFIGSHIVDALLAKGMEVVVLDNCELRVHGEHKVSVPKEVEFIRRDVRDKAVWERALRGIDYVFHEAAYQDYMLDYSKFFDTNVVGTALMYEVIGERHFDVRKVVVASSQAVYGEGQYKCPEHGRVLPSARGKEQMLQARWELTCALCGAEMKPLLLSEPYTNPFNPYALSKYSQELAALRLGKRLGIPTVALRYSIVQGAGQSPFNTYSGICRIFTLRILHGLRPVIYEDGLQLRDYCHIDDVVAANLVVLNDDRANFDSFNVGGGNGTTVRDYAAQLGQVVGYDVEPEIPGKYRVGDNRHSVSSIAKLGELGWSPKKTLRDMMQDYWNWLQSSGVGVAFDFTADSEMARTGVVCEAAFD